MLSFRTGLPGHGKTLTIIAFIDQNFSASGRPIYYSGIPELQLPWFPLEEPDKWYNLPDGAVIVIDEAQRVFPVRAPGGPVPKKVQALETHRHRGIDIFLCTQNPMLVDSHVRRLAGEHVHVKRPWGLEKCVLYRWESVQDNPVSWESSKTAEKKIVPFPVKYYEAYKSASIHTVKRKIPFRFWFLFILIFFLIYSAYSLYGVLNRQVVGVSSSTVSKQLVGGLTGNKVTPASVDGGSNVGKPSFQEMKEQYLLKHTPLVSNVPWTAPVYDEVRKPVVYPKMVCMQLAEQCRCYTQQATRLDTPYDVCRSVLDRGLFDYAKSGESVMPPNGINHVDNQKPVSSSDRDALVPVKTITTGG